MSTDGNTRLHDAQRAKSTRMLDHQRQGLHAVAWCRTTNRIAIGCDDGMITLADPRRTAAVKPRIRRWSVSNPSEHPALIGALRFSADGKTLFSESWDGVIRAWDPEKGRERWRVIAPNRESCDLALEPKGHRLATCGTQNSIQIYDMRHAPPRRVERLGRAKGQGYALRWHPKKPWIAVGDTRGRLRLWNVDTKSLLQDIAISQQPIHDLDFSHDGNLLAVGCGRGELYMLRHDGFAPEKEGK